MRTVFLEAGLIHKECIVVVPLALSWLNALPNNQQDHHLASAQTSMSIRQGGSTHEKISSSCARLTCRRTRMTPLAATALIRNTLPAKCSPTVMISFLDGSLHL
ncbi:MAG: hypothetical protein FJX25_17830 [Alphaproteobacteria bacterium]|nr:hypothetical protein [Alphaproteobacteria bacterium]